MSTLRPGDALVLGWVVLLLLGPPLAGAPPLRGFREDPRLHPVLALALAAATVYLAAIATASLRGLRQDLRDSGPPSFAAERALLRRGGTLLRDLGPLLLTLVFYPLTDALLDAFARHELKDALLARWDLALFGFHPAVAAERLITPLRTDLLSLCYMLHVVVPAVVLTVAALAASRRLFVEIVQGHVTVVSLGLLGYLLVPAVGPREFLADHFTRDLLGGFVGELNHSFVEASRARRDAFPSLHVGLSALYLAYAWRVRPALAGALLPFVAGNWVATIYLRYHYGVDVIAGFLLAIAVHASVKWWLTPRPGASDGR